MGTFYGCMESSSGRTLASLTVPEGRYLAIQATSKPVMEVVKGEDGTIWHKYTGQMRVEGPLTIWTREGVGDIEGDQ